jgi:UDP-N-acetyl-D-mannosaminuronate dehydrogenase
MTVAVIELGYVGLSLSLQSARSGVRVLGLDVDSEKTAKLNRGESYIASVQKGDAAYYAPHIPVIKPTRERRTVGTRNAMAAVTTQPGQVWKA